ncbi:DUF2802 domain-containing protein, partial [Vibrio parahaemolyticus]|nr:DUF2802 domain-containing protein [Vibrio parahaemolyticus]
MAEETLLSAPFLAGGVASIVLVLVVLQLRIRSGLQKQLDQQRAQSRHADKE